MNRDAPRTPRPLPSDVAAPNTTDKQPQPNLQPRARWLSWLALAFGLALAIGAGFWIDREIEGKARSDFARRAHELTDKLASKIRAYSDVVYAIGALMDHENTNEVSRDEFRRFVEALAIPSRYPGLTNVSFAFHVTRADREAFERRVRDELSHIAPGLPLFAIKPPGDRAEYEVVTYTEPLMENAAGLGLDLLSDPVRSDVVRRARDSGTLSTSPGVTLVRDSHAPVTSVLLRLALYRGAAIPPTIESRRAAYFGVAGVSLRMQEILDIELAPNDHQQLRVTVDDVTGLGEAPAEVKDTGRRLFDSLANSTDQVRADATFREYTFVQRIDVGNRVWDVRIEPRTEPLANSWQRFLPYATAATIFTIAVLLFGLWRSLSIAKLQGRALRKSVSTLEFHRRRLAETQEIANIGGWEWDIRQRKQIWSDRLYKLLGRAVGDPPEPTDEFFISRIVHPADIALVRDALKRVGEGGAPATVECRILRPDGAERIVSTVTRLETTDDGARTRLIGTVRDITDERRATERERAQLRFVQTMMDAIPTPVFQKDSSRRFRASNNAWCELSGKSREAVIGRTLDELIPGPHAEAVRAQDQALLERPAASAIEITMPNAAGESRQFIVHKASYLADDGAIAGLVGVMFDITERKRTEQRLQQTVAELDRRNRRAKLLGEFGEALQSCLALDEAYEAVGKYLPRLLPGSGGALFRIDASRSCGERVSTWGPPDGVDAVLASSDCVAIRRGHARWVANSDEELNCRHFVSAPPRSYACLPISAQGELIGLLHVQVAPDGAAREDAELGWAAVVTAGEHIALALANLTLRATLHEQATRDNLTGLRNRNYLHAHFERELARARRKQSPLAVLMVDIDHFKRFNDTFGHAAGDHVLRELGALLVRACRPSDIACRYGGEEFVLILPEASPAAAIKRAEEMREALKGLRLVWEGHPLGSISLSIGVATFPEHGDDAATLIAVADRALYRAKELGRDRVVLAPAASTTPAS